MNDKCAKVSAIILSQDDSTDFWQFNSKETYIHSKETNKHSKQTKTLKPHLYKCAISQDDSIDVYLLLTILLKRDQQTLKRDLQTLKRDLQTLKRDQETPNVPYQRTIALTLNNSTQKRPIYTQKRPKYTKCAKKYDNTDVQQFLNFSSRLCDTTIFFHIFCDTATNL